MVFPFWLDRTIVAISLATTLFGLAICFRSQGPRFARRIRMAGRLRWISPRWAISLGGAGAVILILLVAFDPPASLQGGDVRLATAFLVVTLNFTVAGFLAMPMTRFDRVVVVLIRESPEKLSLHLRPAGTHGLIDQRMTEGQTNIRLVSRFMARYGDELRRAGFRVIVFQSPDIDAVHPAQQHAMVLKLTKHFPGWLVTWLPPRVRSTFYARVIGWLRRTHWRSMTVHGFALNSEPGQTQIGHLPAAPE